RIRRQVQVKEGLLRAACVLAKQLEPHSPQKKLKRILKRLETQTDMAKENSCLTRVATGAAIGGAIGGAVGSVYGTYEAIRFKMPGLLKIRHVGQTTLSSAALFVIQLMISSPVLTLGCT
ncbi:hypothetical protein Prudu_232S000100, partial [Prunus dulcis]